MCLDCGCMEPNNRHGDDRHIVMDDIVNAAEANGTSVDRVLDEMQSTIQQLRSGNIERADWTRQNQ